MTSRWIRRWDTRMVVHEDKVSVKNLLLLLPLLSGCGSIEIMVSNHACEPEAGTYKFTYQEIEGNCGPQPDAVETYKGIPKNSSLSEDQCVVSWYIDHGTYKVESSYSFNEDWSLGKGHVRLVDVERACESVYQATIERM